MDSPSWLELRDVEARSFANRTWIPLLASQWHISEKEFGYAGYRKDAELIESVVIFEQQRTGCENLDWHGVRKSGTVRAWADDRSFHAPGGFYDSDDGDMLGFYPALRKGFDTD